MSKSIYLDFAAATPLDKRVFAVMEPHLKDDFYNPSAAYTPAREARKSFDQAKATLAHIIGGKRDEIIMTAGATESIYVAFQAVLGDNDSVVIGATEHAAVRSVAADSVRVADVDDKGKISIESLVRAVDDTTKLVSITAADSELGTIQPLRAIAQEIQKIRDDRQERGVTKPLYFHTDASQAAGALDLHVARLGVDMMTLNAAKCYGPKQVGLLWSAAHVKTKAVMAGGGQERGLRGGTENVAGAVGFACALEIADHRRHSETKRIAALRDALQKELTQHISTLTVNGSQKKRLPGHLHVSVDGLDAERVVFRLDAQGIYLATGAACAANKGTRSQALMATGMSESMADGSLRISLGRTTTEGEIARASTQIIEAIKEEQGL